ncbi:hypothetical protein ScPMuIL_000090 [Solemya velum]
MDEITLPPALYLGQGSHSDNEERDIVKENLKLIEKNSRAWYFGNIQDHHNTRTMIIPGSDTVENHALAVFTRNTFIAREWRVESVQGLIGAIVLSFVLTITQEGINSYIIFRKKISRSKCKRQKIFLIVYIRKAIVRMLQMFTGYAIMLCVMTFSIFVLVSVCVGSGLGFFFGRYCCARMLLSIATTTRSGVSESLITDNQDREQTSITKISENDKTVPSESSDSFSDKSERILPRSQNTYKRYEDLTKSNEKTPHVKFADEHSCSRNVLKIDSNIMIMYETVV